MLAVADFRAMYPEFASTAVYPDVAINAWLSLAYKTLNPDNSVWGDSIDLGAALFTAHFLVIGARDQKAVAVGGMPGGQSGILSSKSIGNVSAAYAVSNAYREDAGTWNLTSYGGIFWTLTRQFGMGALQI